MGQGEKSYNTPIPEETGESSWSGGASGNSPEVSQRESESEASEASRRTSEITEFYKITVMELDVVCVYTTRTTLIHV